MVQFLGDLSSLIPLNRGCRNPPFAVFIMNFTMHTSLGTSQTQLSFPEGNSLKGCVFNWSVDFTNLLLDFHQLTWG